MMIDFQWKTLKRSHHFKGPHQSQFIRYQFFWLLGEQTVVRPVQHRQTDSTFVCTEAAPSPLLYTSTAITLSIGNRSMYIFKECTPKAKFICRHADFNAANGSLWVFCSQLMLWLVSVQRAGTLIGQCTASWLSHWSSSTNDSSKQLNSTFKEEVR
jgi:hypothetical protein